MEKRVCAYCGTEYDANLQRCPLCGSVNENVLEPEPDPEPEEVHRPARRRGGARVAPKEDGVPRWLSVLICVILAIAVVVGAGFALYSMGIFSSKDKASDSTVSLPLTGETTSAAVSETESTGVVACTALTLDPAGVTLASGESASITALAEPSGCTEKIAWVSSNEKVCTVDENGIVAYVGDGKATVMATCGSKSASCDVTCGASGSETETTAASQETTPASSDTTADASRASLSTTDFTLFSAGETAKITVRDAPSGASVVWTSSNPAVATVSNGTVTAVKSGTATITAEVNGQKLTCIARCNVPGTAPTTTDNAESSGSYKLDHSDVTLGKGESFEISVVGGVSGGWNVSNSSVCTVDAEGNVTAVGSGTAKVYTTVGGQKLECVVRVK